MIEQIEESVPPTPNNLKRLDQRLSDQRRGPGKLWALVEIDADPASTLEEVRDSVCTAVASSEHCLEVVSIRVESEHGVWLVSDCPELWAPQKS